MNQNGKSQERTVADRLTIWQLLPNESCLIPRVYLTQKKYNSVGHWVRLAGADKQELGIKLTEGEIMGDSQDVFTVMGGGDF